MGRRCFDLNDKCFRHTGGVPANSRWFASEASAPPDREPPPNASRRAAGNGRTRDVGYSDQKSIMNISKDFVIANRQGRER